MAQWNERQPGVCVVMGLIPTGDSDFSCVPRSCHVFNSVMTLTTI